LMHGVFEFGNGNTKELQQTANFFAWHSFISERRFDPPAPHSPWGNRKITVSDKNMSCQFVRAWVVGVPRR
jgi:hypothetical protein